MWSLVGQAKVSVDNDSGDDGEEVDGEVNQRP